MIELISDPNLIVAQFDSKKQLVTHTQLRFTTRTHKNGAKK